MKNIIHLEVCTRCRSEENLIKYSLNKKNKRQYYMCRLCNNKRSRAYYKTERGKKNIQKALKKQWNSPEGRIKQNARALVAYHVKQGNIIKPKNCSECGGTEPRIEGHHIDYSKPGEVIWLCTGCHKSADKDLKNNLK